MKARFWSTSDWVVRCMAEAMTACWPMLGTDPGVEQEERAITKTAPKQRIISLLMLAFSIELGIMSTVFTTG